MFWGFFLELEDFFLSVIERAITGTKRHIDFFLISIAPEIKTFPELEE